MYTNEQIKKAIVGLKKYIDLKLHNYGHMLQQLLVENEQLKYGCFNTDTMKVQNKNNSATLAATDVNSYAPETNYIPDSMSFAEGFLGPKGDVGYVMFADYEKAKNIIESLLAQEKTIERVEMGLDGDWCENSCIIFDGGGHSEYDCYELSQWAEPIMIVYYADAPSEKYPVWKKLVNV